MKWRLLGGFGARDKSPAARASALVAQGQAALDNGDVAAAVVALRQAVSLDPVSAAARMNLGNALAAAGETDAAIGEYEGALRLDAQSASAHYNLGLALLNQGEPARVAQHMREAIRLREGFAAAWVGLALAQEAQGELDAAVESYACAHRLDRSDPGILGNLGLLQQQRGRYEEAADAWRRALALRPADAGLHVRLALLYKDHGQIGAAIEHLERALALRPGHAETLGDLGNALQERGDLDGAIDCYRRALAEAPDHAGGHGNLLFALNYHSNTSAAEIYDAYREFDRRFGQPHRAARRPHSNDRNPARRLRVGYVSPDLRRHPVAYFLEPLLAHHDKAAVETWAYAELAGEDEATARYRGLVDHWVPTAGMSDDALAERVRADAIDVLVDLAGHTANNRLGVFARKPAPVSLSWLGYGYTTGLPAIDWLLTDAACAPVGSEALFAETPWRLEGSCFVYRPAEGMGEVPALPALARGAVTFITLSRAVRLNEHVVRVWARILQQVPHSRLVVDSRNYVDAAICGELRARFAAHRIDPSRLELGFHTPPWSVLREADIALDCFPHNSGTTLFESLWMGLPFVTLAGRPSVGRLGSSILRGLGRSEWIAEDEDGYVERAVALASDLPALAALRAGLREQMRSSALM
ncbi:MAG TPA: tetratricopeptide repeat protein, partial [Burkholderiaceae bacterium]